MRVGGGRVAAQMSGWWKSKRFCEVPQAARRGGGRGDRYSVVRRQRVASQEDLIPCAAPAQVLVKKQWCA